MIKNIIIICLSLIIGVTSNVISQEKMVLDLEQSVAIALQNNPELQIAEKEVAKAKASVGEAYATLLPTLDASSRFSHAWDLQRNVIPNFLKPMLEPLEPIIPELAMMPDYVEMVFGLENTFSYGLTLTQPLFLGGAGIAGVKMARAGHRASEHQLTSKRQNLIYQTSDAFYGCLLTTELIGVQEEALDQAQANLDIVLTKYEVGTASGLDKMRAEVEVANLKPVLIAVKNNHQSTLTRLRMVLGLSEAVTVEVKGSLDFTPDGLGDQPLKDLLSQAYLSRPELSVLESQKKLASGGVSMVRSQFLPKIFFQTDYSFLAMRNDLKFGKDDFNKGFTSAISLQIPIFHGFRSQRQYQKAKLDVKIVEDSEKSIRDGIAAEVEIAYNTFGEAREKHQAATESVSLAEEALRLANLMYEEGASTQLDVLSSQLALTRARLNRISALYEYQKARYALRRATGTLVGVL